MNVTETVPELNCTEAVIRFVLEPNSGNRFGVDWEGACAGFGSASYNHTVWVPTLNAIYFSVNPPPTPLLVKVREALATYTLFAVCLFGLLCNLVVLVVLGKDKKKTGTRYLLLALATTDELVLLGHIMVPGRLVSGVLDEPGPALTVFITVLTRTVDVAEVWFIVCLCVERYVVVCFPLHARSLCTVRNSRYLIAGVAAGSFLYRIPLYVSLHTHSPRLFMLVYDVGCNGLVIFLVPMVTLLVLNGRLMLTVLQAKRRLKDLAHVQQVTSRKQGKAMAMTVNVALIVLLFLICQTCLFVWFLWLADSNFLQGRIFPPSSLNLFRYVLQPVAVLAMALNSTLNVFIYFLFYPKFRAQFLETFCACARLRRLRPVGREQLNV